MNPFQTSNHTNSGVLKEYEMSQRIYRKSHLVGHEGITGVSAATLYRWIKNGKFPPPIHLGDRIRGWPSDAVQAWLNARDVQA